MARISPKAVVMNPDGLADSVSVGPFTYIGEEVIIDDNTIIDSNVTIIGKTRIGKSCRFLPGCIVGCPSADNPDGKGKCIIADNNTIREHVIIEAGSDEAGTILGENNLLMVGCYVGHDAELTGDGIFANFTRINHHARIEKFVRTSGFTTIDPYVTVGAYGFTTGYSRIDHDTPPYAIVQGSPFRIRGVNRENLKRCGFSRQTIDTLKKVFRLIFNDSTNLPDLDQLAEIEQTFDDEHVARLLTSLRKIATSPDKKVLLSK